MHPKMTSDLSIVDNWSQNLIFRDVMFLTPPPSSSSSLFPQTHFQKKITVPCRVEFGQSVKLVGSSPELGTWDTEKGVTLEWTEGDVWTAMLEIEEDLEFKVVKDLGNGAIVWEEGDNRVLKSSAPSEVTITFGQVAEMSEQMMTTAEKKATTKNATKSQDIMTPPSQVS